MSTPASLPLFCPALERQCESFLLSFASLASSAAFSCCCVCHFPLCSLAMGLALVAPLLHSCFLLVNGLGAVSISCTPDVVSAVVVLGRSFARYWPPMFRPAAFLVVPWLSRPSGFEVRLRAPHVPSWVCGCFVQYWPTRLPGLEVLPSLGFGAGRCALSAQCFSVFLRSWRGWWVLASSWAFGVPLFAGGSIPYLGSPVSRSLAGIYSAAPLLAGGADLIVGWAPKLGATRARCAWCLGVFPSSWVLGVLLFASGSVPYLGSSWCLSLLRDILCCSFVGCRCLAPAPGSGSCRPPQFPGFFWRAFVRFPSLGSCWFPGLLSGILCSAPLLAAAVRCLLPALRLLPAS